MSTAGQSAIYELEPDRDAGLHGAWRLGAEALAAGCIAVVAAIAAATGMFYVMFPELGALAWDVAIRPRGKWSTSPIFLALTPVATGVIGIAITRAMPYGLASVMLDVGAALIAIVATGSPISPAISAGLLPLVIGVNSWAYPPGILVGTAMLAVVSILWRRLQAHQAIDSPPRSDRTRPDLSPPGLAWVVAMLVFVAGTYGMVRLTGMRFVLFPPLTVIAYEMFGHAASCEWADRPVRLPVACLLTSAGGYALWHLLGASPAAAALSMVWGMMVLRTTRVHVPPVLAVALLPQVMDHPTILYPLAVGLGTSMLSGWFYAYSVIAGRYLNSTSRAPG
jgi:hypothetical protein